jgi:hypothetical protein
MTSALVKSTSGDRMRKGRRLTLGVTVSLALTAGVAFAVTSGGGEPRRAAAARPSSSQVWGKVLAAGQRESRSVELRHWPFAAVVRQPHGMPHKLRTEAEELLGNPAHLGLLFEGARYTTAPDGAGLWVVSGRNVLCMFRAVNIAVACDTTARAYTRGLLLEVYKRDKAHDQRPTKFTLFGIVPDGVSSVIARVGGQSREIAVIHNTLSAEAPTPINVALPSG